MECHARLEDALMDPNIWYDHEKKWLFGGGSCLTAPSEITNFVSKDCFNDGLNPKQDPTLPLHVKLLREEMFCIYIA